MEAIRGVEAGARTIVWRLLGAVDVSEPETEPEMLSMVASLVKEDFLSKV